MVVLQVMAVDLSFGALDLLVGLGTLGAHSLTSTASVPVLRVVPAEPVQHFDILVVHVPLVFVAFA